MTLEHLSLTLASGSSARLQTLRSAGIEPAIQVSEVDEDALLSEIVGGPTQKVLALAAAKARDVAAHTSSTTSDLIIGCDSMFEFGGATVGKPHTPELARERLRAMAGNAGILHTGHYLIHRASGHSLGAVSHATVHIASMTTAEIDAYVASGEPLNVAGSFTVDGLGGPFIDAIEGDYHGVVGISLPLLRAMLNMSGLSITQLWTSAQPAAGTLSAQGTAFVDASHPLHLQHGADGFILCSCGERHWGLNGAGGICAFRRGERGAEVLLQLRSANSHGGDTWGIPGGAIDWNESPEQGALREFTEETGISPRQLKIRKNYVAQHGDWAYTTFIAECHPDVAAIPDNESQALTWFPVNGPFPSRLLPSFEASWPRVSALLQEAIAEPDAWESTSPRA